MKTVATAAILAQALLVAADYPGHGNGYGGYGRRGFGGPGMGFCGGGPDGHCGPFGEGSSCAHSCISSFWDTATPTPTAWCDSKAEIHDCISSACDVDAASMSSYSSRRSSLCSEFLSCSSTGTYTYSYKTPDADWGWGPRGTHTWPTGEVVVTGCPWNGDGWGFPFWHGLGYGDGFWDSLGPGWKHSTITTTVTSASTEAVVTIEKAVSGDQSTVRTIGLAAQTGGDEPEPTGNAAPGGADNKEVKMMGAALGAVIAVAGLL